jgi:putative oxidoreductase
MWSTACCCSGSSSASCSPGTARRSSSAGSAAADPREPLPSGLSELGGGLLLATGLLTPLASFLLATVMLNAIATVVWPKGFFGGYEFELTLATVAIALAATGPGEISLDDAIGWADNITGIAWASLVLGTAIVVSLITTTLGRGSADLDEIPG